VSSTARRAAWYQLRKLGLAVGVAATVGVFGLAPQSAIAKGPAPVLGSVSQSGLPPEAIATEKLIRSNGPFAHSKDGAVFGNRERRLPAERRGYYREYTVRTPGAHDRGARRIVCGGDRPAKPEACYYTDDHYASFRRIVQ
jgi:ribonuclease T1